MNLKKWLLISIGTLFSLSAQAEINYPYAYYKEIEFVNPSMTKHFEDYITQMQRSDIQFNASLEEASAQYEKKLQKELKSAAYRKPEKQMLYVNKLIKKQKKDFINLGSSYLKAELSTFNTFVKNVQSDPNITQEENVVFLKTIKSLYKGYQNVSSNIKNQMNSIEIFCFPQSDEDEDILKIPEWCSYMYTDLEDYVKSSKSQINDRMRIFTKRFIGQSERESYSEQLQKRIDEIQKYKNFKWEK